MNSLITNDFFEVSDIRKELQQKIMSLPSGGHGRAIDAQIKWVGIMEAYKILNLNASMLLDVGSGLSPLCEYFKETVEEVYAIDHDSNWNIEDRIKAGIKYIIGDIITENNFKKNSFDVITDACAVGCSMNSELAIQKISSLLKIGGYFISVGDTNIDTISGPFISPSTWIKICKINGLELVGEYTETNHNLFSIEYGKTLNLVRLVFKKI